LSVLLLLLPLYCLSFFSFCHCIVCPSLKYGCWLPVAWYLKILVKLF
jgi:hypothetical protein